MIVYYIALTTETNWQTLNWLWSYVNENTEQHATAKQHLNVGESMISKLVVGSFESESNAQEFLKVVCGYYGKDLSNIKIEYKGEEI